jgi:hypothetical protein
MTGLFCPRYILTSTNVLQRNGETVLQIKEKQFFFLSRIPAMEQQGQQTNTII